MGPVSVPDRGSCKWRAAVFTIAVTLKAFAVEWVHLGVGSPSTRIVRCLLGSSIGCVQLGAPDPALLATSCRHARLQDRRYRPLDDYLCEHPSMLLLGSKSRTPPASNLANAFGTELPCKRWRCCAPFTAASGKVRGCPRSGPRASASSPSPKSMLETTRLSDQVVRSTPNCWLKSGISKRPTLGVDLLNQSSGRIQRSPLTHQEYHISLNNYRY